MSRGRNKEAYGGGCRGGNCWPYCLGSEQLWAMSYSKKVHFLFFSLGWDQHLNFQRGKKNSNKNNYYKESWVLKIWCFWTAVLEKTLQSPLDCKEIQPVHPKGNQSWIFIGRTDAEAEAPILWPPDTMKWLIGKDPDAGKYWRQEEKGTIEDEMVGWHHQLGHEFGQASGVGDGQGSLAYCSPWGHKE